MIRKYAKTITRTSEASANGAARFRAPETRLSRPSLRALSEAIQSANSQLSIYGRPYYNKDIRFFAKALDSGAAFAPVIARERGSDRSNPEISIGGYYKTETFDCRSGLSEVTGASAPSCLEHQRTQRFSAWRSTLLRLTLAMTDGDIRRMKPFAMTDAVRLSVRKISRKRLTAARLSHTISTTRHDTTRHDTLFVYSKTEASRCIK